MWWEQKIAVVHINSKPEKQEAQAQKKYEEQKHLQALVITQLIQVWINFELLLGLRALASGSDYLEFAALAASFACFGQFCVYWVVYCTVLFTAYQGLHSRLP